MILFLSIIYVIWRLDLKGPKFTIVRRLLRLNEIWVGSFLLCFQYLVMVPSRLRWLFMGSYLYLMLGSDSKQMVVIPRFYYSIFHHLAVIPRPFPLLLFVSQTQVRVCHLASSISSNYDRWMEHGLAK